MVEKWRVLATQANCEPTGNLQLTANIYMNQLITPGADKSSQLSSAQTANAQNHEQISGCHLKLLNLGIVH